MEDWQKSLGRPASATDQPPGYYRFRRGRGRPWQPLRILLRDGLWHFLLVGTPVRGSGEADPLNIAWVRDHGPFHPITREEYDALMDSYVAAEPGSPLTTPDEPVNLRRSPPL